MAELVELHARILAAVSAKRWRGEISLCLEFGGAKTHAPTEDALFALVQAGQLEWFGDNSRPLRYRIPRDATRALREFERTEGFETEGLETYV